MYPTMWGEEQEKHVPSAARLDTTSCTMLDVRILLTRMLSCRRISVDLCSICKLPLCRTGTVMTVLYPEDKCYHVEVTFKADDATGGWGVPDERSCTCPMGERNNVCKHVGGLLYVLAGVGGVLETAGASGGGGAAAAAVSTTNGAGTAGAAGAGAPRGKRPLKFPSKQPTKEASVKSSGKRQTQPTTRMSEAELLRWAETYVAEKGARSKTSSAAGKRRDAPAASGALTETARADAPKRPRVGSSANTGDVLARVATQATTNATATIAAAAAPPNVAQPQPKSIQAPLPSMTEVDKMLEQFF